MLEKIFYTDCFFIVFVMRKMTNQNLRRFLLLRNESLENSQKSEFPAVVSLLASHSQKNRFA